MNKRIRFNAPSSLHGDKNEPISSEMRTAIDRASREFFDRTVRMSVRLTADDHREEDSSNNISRSKFGGIPYWPHDKEWPKSSSGQDMIMVAQLNFDELPSLDGYPKTGILQFFCIDDDWYSNETTTIYHEHPDLKLALANVPRDTCTDGSWKDSSPFQGVIYITGAKYEKMCMTMECDPFMPLYLEILKKYIDIDITSLLDLSRAEFAYVQDTLGLDYNWGQHRIGGWPTYTQNDMMDEQYNTLLLQIDTDKHIQWGDNGIANIFINDKDLHDLNFDNVLYTWDCY